jgi:hypothetical protein
VVGLKKKLKHMIIKTIQSEVSNGLYDVVAVDPNTNKVIKIFAAGNTKNTAEDLEALLLEGYSIGWDAGWNEASEYKYQNKIELQLEPSICG